MREILFRGKRTDNGEWAYGSLLQVTVKGETYYLIFGDSYSFNGHDVTAKEHAPIDPLTVGQYTGLMDRNGKRIFEGDCISGRKYKGVVNFGTGCFCVKDGNHFSNPAIDIVINEDVVVVICNIYDNPELLEV